MKKTLVISLIVSCLVLNVTGQNLVQNPSFENLPTWDTFWVLSLTAPSSPTAVATQITTDAHEGTTSVELSNTVNTKWTYYYTDSIAAPISFLANKSYEVRGWMRSVEEAKKADLSIFWNGAQSFQIIYTGNPDPVSDPDWFMVKDTITPVTDFVDGYLRLGLRAIKAVDGSGAGRLLFDDFSVIRIPDFTETDVTAFSFPEQILPEIIDPGLGTISIEVPYGTDLSALAPDNILLSRGATISPAVGQPQDFSSPVVYTVTAQDESTTRDWTVTVVYSPNTATVITAFNIPELVAPATINTLVQLVMGSVPYGTDLTTLVPTIAVSPGASINPVSGVATDFSSPITYTVTAEDGITIQDWVVAILVEPNTATDITSFNIPELVAPATIDNSLHTVVGSVPFVTDLTALVPSIAVSAGATIDPVSGAATDFSVPVTYTVTAEDGTTIQDWVVTIQALPNTETDITSFDIPELLAPVTIDNSLHTVAGSVPYGTDLTVLVPSIVVSAGATIDPVSGAATDFSAPVTYTVTAEDGTTIQDWVVTIQALPNTETDITSFDIPELLAPATIDNSLHTVVGNALYGTDLTTLVPSIAVSAGATIDPVSGAATDFSAPVTYTVTAEDGTTIQDWVVTIQAPANTETDITSFDIPELVAPATIDNSLHTVVGSVPYGTDLTALVPSIAVSAGATIDPVSGAAIDFSAPVTYTVTAEDGTTIQDWVVTIQALPNTETDITSFNIPELLAPATIDNSLHTVVGSVPYGTDLTALVPSIAVSAGATIDPVSGAATDFSAPVTYTVTAEDGTTIQDWLVTIQALPNTETDITAFSMAEQTGVSTINNVDHTIEIEVAKGTDLTFLAPVILVSPGATIDPASGVSRDFTNSKEYLVTAEDGFTTQNWQITVTIDPAVGIGKTDIESIRIYPNPATEFIHIDLPGVSNVRLQDLMGKLCYSVNDVIGELSINISDFKKGIYIVSLYMEDGSLKQRKVIIQ